MSRSARQLSDDERILWNQVARTATPLKGKVRVADEPATPMREESPAVAKSEAAPVPSVEASRTDRFQLQHLDAVSDCFLTPVCGFAYLPTSPVKHRSPGIQRCNTMGQPR